MNILYDLQLSVLTGLNDGDFIFQTDSNVNVATFTINDLLEKNKDYTFYVLVPPKEKLKLIKGTNKSIYSMFTDKLDKKRVKLIEYPYYGNPFVDRKSFDARALKKALKNINIDLVYTNDPCKVLSYKTFFYHKQDEFLPVLTRNHWVSGKAHRKLPEEIDFFMSQVEGSFHAAGVSFNSKYALQLFLENAKEYYNDETIKKIEKKSYYMETVDIDKIDKYKVDKTNEVFTILWAHRLSYYTGWVETFDALAKLYKKRQDFKLIVPDPGNKFTQKELHEKYPFIEKTDKKSWTHKKYIETCWTSDLALGNHKYPATWGGLALTEPMTACTVPLMPNRYAYLEMYYKNKDKVFFEDENELIELVEYYMDKPFKLSKAKKNSRLFCENVISKEKYVNKIEKIINKVTKK